MGIEALPSSTVRAIGATQVLNDPASAIKELLDNSLDANSTSISIEIHNNTLDVIQVRDNGHGIPPEDRLLVARPHCTSKITGEDDLKTIGGTSLGFRGEALASATEMSGSLIISTRVEGEEVATALKINQQGEVVGQDRASLPVGTTVKITDFIKAHPVRRQVALKNAEKTLAKIKQTLKAYAFARPQVRLSLRVLKAKNDKGNWMYAPKAGGNVEDAAFKIVGTACASQCTWAVVEDHGFALQAFLPRPDADIGKCANIGAFLSVDARPVSTIRGTLKQIMKIFRDALKKANPKAEGLKDAFLFLDIQCPSASYDANVEPAKDDVLFENPDKLIVLVRQLFEAVYPSMEVHQSLKRDQASEAVQSLQVAQRRLADEDDFITSLESADPKDAIQPLLTLWTPLPARESLPNGGMQDDHTSPHRKFRSNMFVFDDDDLKFDDGRPESSHTAAEFEELRRARHDVNASNPWIMAKMNASSIRQARDLEVDEDTLQPWDSDVHRVSDREHALPTPGPSSPTKAALTPNCSASDFDHPSPNDSRAIGSQMLPPLGPSIPPTSQSDLDQFGNLPGRPYRQPPSYNRDSPARDEAPVSGTPLSAVPNALPQRKQSPKRPMRQGQLNAPFNTPMQEQPPREKVWFDHLEKMNQRQSLKRPYQLRDNDGLVMPRGLGDLASDPRPLTPPRQNRDMRDFLTARDEHVHQSITNLVESRQYPQQRRGRSIDSAANLVRFDDENTEHESTSGMLIGRGFIPASELATSEGAFGSLKPDSFRAQERRKTSERQALRDLSGNAPVDHQHDAEEHEAMVDTRAASSHRRTTTGGNPSKSRRTKSSRLPLERVPKGQGMHNIVVSLSKSMREISSIAGNIDEDPSLLGYNDSAVDAYDVFAPGLDVAAVEGITVKLHELLGRHVPEGHMVQDLSMVVQDAFASHSQHLMEADA